MSQQKSVEKFDRNNRSKQFGRKNSVEKIGGKFLGSQKSDFPAFSLVEL